MLHQRLDVLHTVVGCRVKFEDIERPSLVEGAATLALSAGIAGGSGAEAVYYFCEDARTGGLAHAARATEEVRMGELA